MEILIYIAKASLFLILFYACYLMFLRKNTFFTLNRFYLLSSLVASFLLPFVVYPEQAPALPVIYQTSAPVITVTTVAREESLFTTENLMWLIYIAGALWMAFQLYHQIRSLRNFLSQGIKVDQDDSVVVIIDNNNIGSFSFLKWIVVNINDYENHFDEILRHETVHRQQKHSMDILLVELIRIVFWFNPILILYKKSLQEVHEFLADIEAPDKETYARFLVSYSLNAPIASLTNHFFKPAQIKSRIQMIYKNRTSKWLLSTYCLAIGSIILVAIGVAGCDRVEKDPDIATKAVSGETVEIEGYVTDASNKKAIAGANIVVDGLARGTSTDKDGHFAIHAPSNGSITISSEGFSTQLRPLNGVSNHIIALSPGSDIKGTTAGKIFTVVEQQPEFPGGVKAMYDFIGDHMKYPEAASRAYVSGRVFLSFVVTETGEIADVTVLKGIGFGCDAEAIRVLKSFPKWTPGKQDGKAVSVKYNLPINFQLEDHKKSSSAANKQLGQIQADRAAGSDNKTPLSLANESLTKVRVEGPGIPTTDPPLVVINGKISKDPNILTKLDPNTISSINVLKGKTAVAEFGETAKNGAILVSTK